MSHSRLEFPALPARDVGVVLPVYLLADISGSMEGAPLAALVYALENFVAEALDDPYAAETIAVGFIPFAAEARLVGGGLVPVRDWALPALEAGGPTRLDLAFEAMSQSLQRDVQPRSAERPTADFGPLAFVLTDGMPTTADGQSDDVAWRAARETVLRPAQGPRCHGIVVFGCGPDVDDATLRAVSTGAAFHGAAANFSPFFQFVSQTLTASLQGRHSPVELLKRLPPPPGVRRID